MTTYSWGDVVLVDFPQSGVQARKRRPAMVVLDIGDADVLLAPITSRLRSSPGDVGVIDLNAAGLLAKSWLRLAKSTCLEKKDVVRQLGKFSPSESQIAHAIWLALFP